MKIKFLLLIIACAIIASCSKNNVAPVEEPPTMTSGESTTVLYIDTFRVYSTNLKGENRKLLVDEDLKSGNNYIMSTSIIPGSNKIVYSYTTGYLDPTTIKVAAADGSTKAVVKTFPAGQQIGFVKGMAGNKIYYSISKNQGGVNSVNYYSMNDDGTGETEIKGFPYYAFMHESTISNQGKGFLANAGYFVKIKDGIFLEQESFNVLANENKTNIMGDIVVANDASKLAWVSKTSVDDKFEVRVKDITTKTTTSTVAYTYTVPAEFKGNVFNDFFNIYWVDGNKKVMLEYGKSSSPKGAATDYSFCQIIDITTGTVSASWNFTGDGNSQILVN